MAGPRKSFKQHSSSATSSSFSPSSVPPFSFPFLLLPTPSSFSHPPPFPFPFPSFSSFPGGEGNPLPITEPKNDLVHICRVVASVSTSRSYRDGLETYQRLVSVSSREKLSTSRSRLGLGHLRLGPKTNFRKNCAVHSTRCERACQPML